jgi:dCMP deaminase
MVIIQSIRGDILMDRPSLDDYFFEIAEVVAKRATCLHRKVGVVIVRDGFILSTGYNGAPRGELHCDEVGCSKPVKGTNQEKCRAVHSEINAIIQAALHGVSIQGATIYSTLEPCSICTAACKNAGLIVKYKNKYY